MKALSALIERLVLMLWNRMPPRRHPAPAIEAPSDHFTVGTKCPLCPEDSQGEAVLVSPAERSKPNYLVGATGSGKSNSMFRIIDWEIRQNRTVVFLDLRGDGIPPILRRCIAANVAVERVTLIDLADATVVTPFNFLARGSGDPYRRVLPVLDFVRSRADGLGPQTEDVLRSCLVALAETGSSLLDLDRLLADDEFRASIVRRVTDPYTISFFARLEGLSKERRSLWALPVANKLAPFLSQPTLRRMFAASSCLDLTTMLDTPGQVVLVSLGVDHLHEAAHLVGSLFVGAIERAVLGGRIDQPASKRLPIRLFIDEFENFTGTAFESLIQEGRRFGLSLTVAHQNQSQLDTKTRHLIRNNACLRFLFGTGPIDAAELSAEIITMSRDDARHALLKLQPGEVVLVRSGAAPVKVSTPLVNDPNIDSAVYAAYRDAALHRHAVPADEVDRLLADRIRHAPPTTDVKMPEVRHGRLPRL